jgi:hypothetical protein
LPWDRAEELSDRRRRQQEISKQLAAATEPSLDRMSEAGPVSTSPGPGAPPPPADPARSAEDIGPMTRVTVRRDAIRQRPGSDSPGVGL